MKVQFNFKTRQALQVASAIHDFLCPTNRADVLSVQDSEESVAVRFQGGLVAKIFLFNLSSLKESWREKYEEWVVYKAQIRYYPTKNSSEKIEEEWGSNKLSCFQKNNWWHHPHVKSVDDIVGRIGIFWNTGEANGYVDWDFDYNQDGYYNLSQEFSYRVLVPGDKEAVLATAKKMLKEYYS